MPVIATAVKCKQYGFEIRSDWKFCPNCGIEIICTSKYQAKTRKQAGS